MYIHICIHYICKLWCVYTCVVRSAGLIRDPKASTVCAPFHGLIEKKKKKNGVGRAEKLVSVSVFLNPGFLVVY